MHTVTTINELRVIINSWRKAGERIAFVPTMGNLHRGHTTLIDVAKQQADRVVASIFVNPLQFGRGEDFGNYPRTPEADSAALAAHGTDLLFMPAESEIYPFGRDGVTTVDVPGISETLCGESRPGHFRGVATVVGKLFNIVQPDVALFGQKDFQQVAVLQRMVRDLNFPIEVISVPTVRDSDGLALSSRNGYLTPDERQRAPLLYQTLRSVAERVKGGDHDFAAIEIEAAQRLADGGFEADYVAIRTAAELSAPEGAEPALIVLAAARLGKARLIDNLLIDL
ncbi:MAG TPA: pantoate--beta-alanine ligase [Gammaproteobacteria bacterium]